MPLVSPHLLKDPDDMAIMVAGQRFFRDVLLTGPLGKRIEKVIAPAGPDLCDEVMADALPPLRQDQLPPGQHRPHGRRRRPHGRARRPACGCAASTTSASPTCRRCPNINAGNTNAPAMMLGDRCADFILGLDQPRASTRPAALQGANA